MKKLLIVVDMQEDFISGALGSEQARAIVPAVRRLVEEASSVVYTQDTHGADYAERQEGRKLPVPHCIRGTRGWEILPEVYKKGSRIFEKGTFGSLPLAEYAKREGFDEITLCGVCTDICVVSCAMLLKAYLPETEIRVVADACAGVTPEKHAAALETMRSCQITVI